MAPFEEVLFPLPAALRARGGPERLTEIVTLASGREERNTRWSRSRRRYEVGGGLRSVADLQAVAAFFEARRGRLVGFRFRDRLDFRSSADGTAPTATDQSLGVGAAGRSTFQLVKRYGAGADPYLREIRKPVAGTVKVAVGGVEKTIGTDFTLDAATGVVTFLPTKLPAVGQSVTAGFDFDVPVRFDTDRLDIDLASFAAGEAVSIPLIEIVV